jgi:hypothetical protein
MRNNDTSPSASVKFRELLAVLSKMDDKDLLEAEGQIQLHIAMRFSGSR